MASAIGVRVYLISLHKKGVRGVLPFETEGLNSIPPRFVTDFVRAHSVVVQDEERERSWYFDQKETTGLGNSIGYVRYGTFGFESDFIDNKTKRKNYRRKVTDVEEIPLFYEFWQPKQKNYSFAVFQSFQGRSCINLVISEMQEVFEEKNPGFMLQVKKLMPSSVSMYHGAPVKRLKLIRKNAPADLTGKYLPSRPSTPIDFKLSFIAKRRGSLGKLSLFTGSLKRGAAAVIMDEGPSFDKAVADIRVGGRLRRVGVFGVNSDAGVIDLSDVIDRGIDGHPTFESLRRETNSLLKDFYKTVSGGGCV